MPISGSLERIIGSSEKKLNRQLMESVTTTNIHQEDYTQDSSEAGYLRDLSVHISDVHGGGGRNISLKESNLGDRSEKEDTYKSIATPLASKKSPLNGGMRGFLKSHGQGPANSKRLRG